MKKELLLVLLLSPFPRLNKHCSLLLAQRHSRQQHEPPAATMALPSLSSQEAGTFPK